MQTAAETSNIRILGNEELNEFENERIYSGRVCLLSALSCQPTSRHHAIHLRPECYTLMYEIYHQQSFSFTSST